MELIEEAGEATVDAAEVPPAELRVGVGFWVGAGLRRNHVSPPLRGSISPTPDT